MLLHHYIFESEQRLARTHAVQMPGLKKSVKRVHKKKRSVKKGDIIRNNLVNKTDLTE